MEEVDQSGQEGVGTRRVDGVIACAAQCSVQRVCVLQQGEGSTVLLQLLGEDEETEEVLSPYGSYESSVASALASSEALTAAKKASPQVHAHAVDTITRK